MPSAYRSKQRIVTVSITNPDNNDVKNFTARTKSGGGISGNSEKAFLGGMTPSVSIGGDPEREDITVGIAYTDAVRANFKWLNDLAGRGLATVTERLNGVGATDVYTGYLDQVN